MAALEIDDDPRAKWILGELRDSLRTGHGGIELTTHFDYGMDFLADFAKKFPGRRPDPNYTSAKIRVYRLLRRMEQRGWCRSRHSPNYGGGIKWVTEWQITSRGVFYLENVK